MSNVKIYIPTVKGFTDTAFLSLGVMRDELIWSERNQYQEYDLFYTNESQISGKDAVTEIYIRLIDIPEVGKVGEPRQAYINIPIATGFLKYDSTYVSYKFNSRVYEKPEFPAPVYLCWNERKGYLYCHFHSNPNKDGMLKKGKIFFPDKKWDISKFGPEAQGPALVSITREFLTYGFVKGEFINFEQMCASRGEIIEYNDEYYDPHEVLLYHIDSPVRGKYLAEVFGSKNHETIAAFYHRSDTGHVTITHEYSEIIFNDLRYTNYHCEHLNLGRA